MRRVKKTRCADCRHFRRHTGDAVRERGVTLQPGERYCMAGKKTRRFRPSDPKIYPPKWCIVKRKPPVLRIYTERPELRLFRDLQQMKDQKRRGFLYPSANQYTLKMKGAAKSEGREFHQKVSTVRREQCYVARETITEYLGAEVREGDIVEFDDGILPVFFYVDTGSAGWVARLIHFEKKDVHHE